MPTVRFVKQHIVKQGDGLGPHYRPGDVVDVPPSYAEKYLRRGLAVPHAVEPQPVQPEPEPVVGDPGCAAEAMSAQQLLDALENDPEMKNFLVFKAAAQKILGDATPAKKADIIEALMAMATEPEPTPQTEG